MLPKDIEVFAKRTGFKKTKLGWFSKTGFQYSESEIKAYYNEVELILKGGGE